MRFLPALLTLLAAVLSGRAARGAPGDDACFLSAVEGQRERNEGHLSRAKAEFATCANPSCDTKVLQRCVTWLAEVAEAMPTIVIGVQDSQGRDLTEIAVFVDGARVDSARDGMAVPVDPGPHVVRIVQAGKAPVEQRVIVREHEKARPVRVVIFSDPPEARTATRPIPSIVYALGGVAIAAAGVSTYFAISGLNDRSSFGCSSGCSPSEATRVSRELLASDLSGIVALTALGVATWIYVADRRSAKGVSLSAGASDHGASALVTARF